MQPLSKGDGQQLWKLIPGNPLYVIYIFRQDMYRAVMMQCCMIRTLPTDLSHIL